MNQLAINQDVLDISEAIELYGNSCNSIGYAQAMRESAVNMQNNATSLDDAEAYSNSAERLANTISVLKDNKNDYVVKIKRAFEHYYS